MDYGYIINRAFKLTWKYKFLWLFGIFMASGTPNFNFNLGSPDFNSDPGAARMMREALSWAAAHIGLIVAIAAIVFLFMIIFFVLGVIARGAVIGAANAAEAGFEPAFKSSFSIGLRYFWRLLGLSLLVGLSVFLIIILLLIPIIFLGIMAFTKESVVAIVLLVILALLFILLLIPFFIALGLTTTYAERYIVVDDMRIMDAFRSGWRLFRGNMGTTLLVWLLGIALAIAAGMVLIITLLILAVPAGLFMYAIFSGGFSAGKVAAAILVGLALLTLFLLASGVVQVYFSCYWTLAWRRLAGKDTPEIEAATSSE